MTQTLIIGFGNPIRGDDAVGHRAACILMEEVDQKSVTIKAVPQLLPEMAYDLAEHDLVIFIDACVEGEAGEVRCRKLNPSSIPLGEMPHTLKPEALLGLTDQVYDISPDATLVTLTGTTFEFGEELSAEVQAAIPELVDVTQKLIAE